MPLAHLWVDTELTDGASARGLAKLSQDIRDALTEVSTIGKRGAGVWAAAGDLDFARPLRRGLLGILFRSAGIPEEYSMASCYLWMRDEGLLEPVRKHIEEAGKDLRRALTDMYAGDALANALMQADPEFATSPAAAKEQILAQFPPLKAGDEITEQQMLDAIARLLKSDGTMPCTLIVLDELQEYIGDRTERSLDVRHTTEACTAQFGDRLLFVGTGQAALAETPALQPLHDRFTCRVPLADTDVENVTRQIVLAKRDDNKALVEDLITDCSGEIDRQLHDTQIGPSPEDNDILTADYPILPARRRFWEQVLRAMDKAGIAAQLRTQLRTAHEAVKAIADQPLGTVVPADFLYDQQATGLVQSGVLLRETYEIIARYQDGTPEGELKKSLCALCWLIGQLPRETGADIGVRATPEMLADLLVDDLRDGGAALRERVPSTLEELERDGHLMRVGDEFFVQSREGAVWLGEYHTQYASIINNTGRIADERARLLREQCGEALKPIKLMQGVSNVPRELGLHFSNEAPPAEGDGIPVRVRSGWEDSQNNVLHQAREAGPESPIVYVFLPRHADQKIKEGIAEWKAAEATLSAKGVPATQEGLEARSWMETRHRQAKRKVEQAVSEVINEARVFQAVKWPASVSKEWWSKRASARLCDFIRNSGGPTTISGLRSSAEPVTVMPTVSRLSGTRATSLTIPCARPLRTLSAPARRAERCGATSGRRLTAGRRTPSTAHLPLWWLRIT